MLYIMQSLPVVDFSSPNREENARKLIEIMETVGFLYLDNVPGYDRCVEEELLELNKWFFNLPYNKKMEVARRMYNKTSKVVYRGYFGLDKDYSSYKEGIEFGQDETTFPGFKEDREEFIRGYPLTEHNVWPQPSPEDDDNERQKYALFKEKMIIHYRYSSYLLK